jgi:hypothetical protein
MRYSPREAKNAVLAATFGMGVMAAIKGVFDATDGRPIFQSNLLATLSALRTAEGIESEERGETFESKIRGLIKHYGIEATQIRIGAITKKGYRQFQFEKAFSLYAFAPGFIEMAAKTTTSIYMRGLFDGLREGMSADMTPRKHKMALDGMSAICKKIFEYVPIAEAQTANQIVTAMRHTSTRPDLKTATGCLNSLKDAGIVIEPERGLFRQVVPRETMTVREHWESAIPVPATKPLDSVSNTIPPEAAPNWSKEEMPVPSKTVVPASESRAPAERRSFAELAGDPPQSPAQKFGDLAVSLRLKAQNLMRLADDIDEAALAFEQEIDDATKKLNQFNALKALLTS